MSRKLRKFDIDMLLLTNFIILIKCILLMLFSLVFCFHRFFSRDKFNFLKLKSFMISCVYLLCGRDTIILLIELFIAHTSIIHRSFKWCNKSYIIKSSKRTLVLTCTKLSLKTLNLKSYFKCFLIRFY